MPVRIQRKRTRGWRMPEGAISCTRPGRWGNPFKCPPMSREAAVRTHRNWVLENPEFVALIKKELSGFDLACFCGLDQLCHVDTLLEIANA